MEIYVLIAVVIILCIILFIALKKLIFSVNAQNDAAYFQKMQDLDQKILEKQIKLDENPLEEEKIVKENKEIEKEKDIDKNLIDILFNSDYKNEDFMKTAKNIDEIFNVDSKSVIEKFLSTYKENDNYKHLESIQAKFSPNLIYKLKSLDKDNQIIEINKLLSYDEKLLFQKYIDTHKFKLNNFLMDLNAEVTNTSPVIEVLTGNKNENYDYLSENIKTIYDSSIYKGIIIKYQNKIYNYSLSERDGQK